MLCVYKTCVIIGDLHVQKGGINQRTISELTDVQIINKKVARDVKAR